MLKAVLLYFTQEFSSRLYYLLCLFKILLWTPAEHRGGAFYSESQSSITFDNIDRDFAKEEKLNPTERRLYKDVMF
jgi:hypothetical protein